MNSINKSHSVLSPIKFFVFSLRKNFFTIVIIIFTLLLVVFSTSNLNAAKNGLALWANNVIPALFPFFIATELLSHTNIIKVLGKCFNKFMRPIFNIPGIASYPLIMGIVSGYPVGAKIVTELRQKNMCTKVEGERMLAFTNNSGPLFILGTIGIGIFKDTTTGIILLITHFLAGLTVGFLFRFWKYKDTNITFAKSYENKSTTIKLSNIGEILTDSIKKSIINILNIGGFIVLFSVIISIIKETHFINLLYFIFKPLFEMLNINEAFSYGIINGFLELTNGLYQVASIPIKNISFTIIICAFILGFGGISVLLQVYSFVSKSYLSIKPYILGKFLQGIIAAFYTFVIFHFFNFLSLDLSNIINIFA